MTFNDLRKRARIVADSYRQGSDRPLGGYLRSLAMYGGAVAASAAAVKASGRPLPDRIEPYDVLLLGIATHKASRTITKEAVTSPLRAPFTEFSGPAGPAELQEEVTADGHSHALGELLTCPFCMAQWVATGLSVSLLLAPRATRVMLATLTARALSDALQLAYSAGEQAVEG